MKDLKHLIYFENLLQEAQNELVTRAVDEGKLGLGYNCYYVPEVLLNLPGCFSSRLRAPRCTSPDIATYYMTNRNCPLCAQHPRARHRGRVQLSQRPLRRGELRGHGAYAGSTSSCLIP